MLDLIGRKIYPIYRLDKLYLVQSIRIQIQLPRGMRTRGLMAILSLWKRHR